MESVNGHSLSNVEHREAVKAVKDLSSGCLNLVIKRRRATNTVTGIGCVLQAVGKSPRPVSMATEPQVQVHEFSIPVSREGLYSAPYVLLMQHILGRVSAVRPPVQALGLCGRGTPCTASQKCPQSTIVTSFCS